MRDRKKKVLKAGWKPDDFFENREIKDAERGNAAAARKLLEAFCDGVENCFDSKGNLHHLPSGSPFGSLDPELLAYLARCFRQVLGDVETDKALGLRPGEIGAPKKDPRERLMKDAEIVRAVQIQRDNKMSVKDAKASVARKYSASAVEHAWKNKNAKVVAALARSELRGKLGK
jgi:hypothetical protein